MYERLLEFTLLILKLLASGAFAAVVGFLIFHFSEKYARSKID